jgi:hypothetical protein
MKNAEENNRNHNLGPVFVIGMNGSGTTMLGDCLARHPDLFMFPRETRILPYFISKMDKFGELSELPARRKLADAIGRCFAFWRANKNRPVILENEALTRPGFSEVVSSIYMYFAAAEGKMQWGDKTPMYLQHVSLLASHFPDARFLHIYRDGRDVAQSVHRRWKLHHCRTIYRWKKIVATGRVQGLKLGASRYFELSYETFTQNPEKSFRAICNFLSLPFYASILRASMRQMDPKIKSESIVQNTDKWKMYFSEKQIFKMESVAGGLLSELGYAAATNAGDQKPSTLRQLWWWLYDRFQAIRHQTKKIAETSANASFKKIVALIRQTRANIH